MNFAAIVRAFREVFCVSFRCVCENALWKSETNTSGRSSAFAGYTTPANIQASLAGEVLIMRTLSGVFTCAKSWANAETSNAEQRRKINIRWSRVCPQVHEIPSYGMSICTAAPWCDLLYWNSAHPINLSNFGAELRSGMRPSCTPISSCTAART